MSHSRRQFFAATAGLAAGLSVASLSAPAPTEKKPELSLRLAHLTDVHVRPGAEPERGFAKALEHAQGQKPHLLVNGGDAIFDAAKAPMNLVEQQWAVFHRILKQHSSTPILHCLGNHDIPGWGTEEREIGSKSIALEQLKLELPYYHQDHGDWRLIVLDSIGFHPQRSTGYVAGLGPSQFEWLEKSIREAKGHVCIISHIPILAACPFYDGPNEQSGDWRVPGEWMHLDSRRLKDLFGKYPQVKVCLSGHIHLEEELRYLGVDYYCNGAVSGDYWRGKRQDFDPAYAIVDLYDDGSSRRLMIPYQS